MPMSRSLPLIDASPASSRWQGLRPASQLPIAAQSAEPEFPQGDYGTASVATALTFTSRREGTGDRRVELLAPAGGLDAGFAAFHFSADAIYLGLKNSPLTP